MPPRILVLGGTGEARALASELTDRDEAQVTSSLAGRVRDPRLPDGHVRIGGFGGADGLAAYLAEDNTTAVVDATHPFAEGITANAFAACRTVGVPMLALRRPGWTEQSGDRWYRVDSLTAAAATLPAFGDRVFLSTGRLGLSSFGHLDQWFLVRTIDQPDPPMPRRSTVVLARGPFSVDDELALLREHRIDVLVTKDSGGSMTAAKLEAARTLGIPVIVVQRPPVPDVPTVSTVEDAVLWVETARTDHDG
ncbi:cobalt-precorrin-6A reductase [Allosaccharopolyspora coralli]|uniref:Cobalt-precorrin-6A reductase n=1 Tax=Allosaccharopolyspora coralli TaxID=2665642 RepID=A0A5Q3QHG1_9PSEU|nr:cobalt-precorrin-6A reductase [Allosaccharopolyspora coralli]QGK70965.1 cobalt-precorrin-6A reductase [Allosaccharopolyspora coralli]